MCLRVVGHGRDTAWTCPGHGWNVLRAARDLYLALPNTRQHDAVGVMERCVCDGTPCDETPTEMVGDGVSPRRVWVCGAASGLWPFAEQTL